MIGQAIAIAYSFQILLLKINKLNAFNFDYIFKLLPLLLYISTYMYFNFNFLK